MNSSRVLALEYLVKLSDLTCLDALRNHSFRDETLKIKVDTALKQILTANFKKECPYCSEIIKSQAQKCMHCKENV